MGKKNVNLPDYFTFKYECLRRISGYRRDWRRSYRLEKRMHDITWFLEEMTCSDEKRKELLLAYALLSKEHRALVDKYGMGIMPRPDDSRGGAELERANRACVLVDDNESSIYNFFFVCRGESQRKFIIDISKNNDDIIEEVLTEVEKVRKKDGIKPGITRQDICPLYARYFAVLDRKQLTGKKKWTDKAIFLNLKKLGHYDKGQKEDSVRKDYEIACKILNISQELIRLRRKRRNMIMSSDKKNKLYRIKVKSGDTVQANKYTVDHVNEYYQYDQLLAREKLPTMQDLLNEDNALRYKNDNATNKDCRNEYGCEDLGIDL